MGISCHHGILCCCRSVSNFRGIGHPSLEHIRRFVEEQRQPCWSHSTALSESARLSRVGTAAFLQAGAESGRTQTATRKFPKRCSPHVPGAEFRPEIGTPCHILANNLADLERVRPTFGNFTQIGRCRSKLLLSLARENKDAANFDQSWQLVCQMMVRLGQTLASIDSFARFVYFWGHLRSKSTAEAGEGSGGPQQILS